MRTKTPLQIYEQWQRMARNARTPENIERVKRAAIISRKYWDNIYRANGMPDRLTSSDTARANYIWYNAATPASIYAK